MAFLIWPLFPEEEEEVSGGGGNGWEGVIGQAVGLLCSGVPGLLIRGMNARNSACVDGATGLNDTCLPQHNPARQVWLDLIQFGLVCVLM